MQTNFSAANRGLMGIIDRIQGGVANAAASMAPSTIRGGIRARNAESRLASARRSQADGERQAARQAELAARRASLAGLR
jgi:hypothetical protein